MSVLRLTGWVNSPTKSIKVDKVSYPEGEKAVQVVGCIEQKKKYILVYIVVDYMLWCLTKKKEERKLHGVYLKNTLWLSMCTRFL